MSQLGRDVARVFYANLRHEQLLAHAVQMHEQIIEAKKLVTLWRNTALVAAVLVLASAVFRVFG